MLTQGGAPGLREVYLNACVEFGTEPAAFIDPPAGTVTSGFVAKDPDRAWHEIGPFLLHDARMYAAWMGTGASASKSVASTVDELRDEGGPYRIFSPDEAVAHVRERGVFLTQPLCGGLATELAWQSLQLLVDEVLPVAARG